MTGPQFRLDIVVVFFIYGLAFFSMGIALLLEAGLLPSLAEKRFLLPLATFGILHGAHEWVEVFLLQGTWLGLSISRELAWGRVVWLAVSFVFLLVFGLMVVNTRRRWPSRVIWLAAILILYLSLVCYHARLDPLHQVERADALARYILAIPASWLAAAALWQRGLFVEEQNRRRRPVAQGFQWAALGFGIYGLAQVFVTPVDMFPATLINTQVFQIFTGFPIQIVRAAAAVWITVSMIRTLQYVVRERDTQLTAAQQARLDALEQVQHELEAREAMRHELLRHTVIAQEDERARIARELHDETAQILTGFSLNLAMLRNDSFNHPEIIDALNRLQGLSQQMSSGIYRLVHDLRPAQLDDLGLVPALQYLVEQERQRNELNVTLEVQGHRQRLDPLLETVIFRVAQEALTNVVRHAQVKSAMLHLSFEPQRVVLQVRDQGVGFDVTEDHVPPRGWGLAGMRERAESVGGSFQVMSAPEQGTTVEIIVPIGASA